MKLFKFKKETEASRLYRIYMDANVDSRVKHIADHEFKRFIYLAEKAALTGYSSVDFELDISETDMPFINLIIYEFISRIQNEGFTYSRQIFNKQKTFSIYFSKPTKFTK